MSNPVTNVEIEDVLSSIRRLVSEEPNPKPAAQTEEASRFVLTPAFRVATDSDSVAAVQPDDELSETVGSEFAVPESEIGGTEHADGMDVESSDDPTALADEAEPDVLATDDPVTQAIQEAEVATQFTSFEHRVVELEQAVEETEDDWEPDGSEPDTDEIPDRHIFQSTRVARADAALEQDGDINAPVSDLEQSFEDKLFEEMEAERLASDGPEVGDSDKADAGDDQVIAHEATELAVVDAPDVAEPDVAEPDETDDGTKLESEILLLDEQIMDEEALSELVTDIVRRELQGSLGERITRNVRRMVRREIQRAMALKDFE